IALQLLFELLEQGERVGRRAGEAREDLPALEGPDLGRVGLHDRVAERDLTVAAHGHVSVAPDAQDRGAVYAHWSPGLRPATLHLRPRMRAVVDLLEALYRRMSIHLRGRERGVAEQFLHGAQIRAGVEQVSREGMA